MFPVSRTRVFHLSVLLIGVCWAAPAYSDRPQTIGSSTTTITYETGSGPISFTGERDYGGTSILDVTNLGGAPNVGTFNAFNLLGRKSAVGAFNPSVQGPDESLLRHGFYKTDINDQLNIDDEFFPDLAPDGNITVSVENIKFDRPISVVEEAFLLHVLWDAKQADALEERAYVALNNHHISDPFRDFDSFFGPGGVFFDLPVPNYAFTDSVVPVFTQSAPDELSMTVSFPYSVLRNFEDDGQGAPPDLPAPQDFLEPFHFHIEYFVVPEPAALALLLGGLTLAGRTKRAHRTDRLNGRAGQFNRREDQRK